MKNPKAMFVSNILPKKKGRRIMIKNLFVFGSSKDVKIPLDMLQFIETWIADGKAIIIGDAPGVDTKIQDFLYRLGAKNVTVYTAHSYPRYIVKDSNWNIMYVNSSNFPENSIKFLSTKDDAMCKDADCGICCILENGSRASRANIERLKSEGKHVICFIQSFN